MKKQKITGQKKSRILQNSVFVLAMVILLVFLVFSVLLAITFGNADISFKDVYSVVLYEIFHIKKLSAFSEGAIHDVVWLIRFPRILLAMSVGIGLAVCGVVIHIFWVFHQVPLWVQHWRSCLESEALSEGIL